MVQGSSQQSHKHRLISLDVQVAPMLNPDGVIVGNYRCSLAGLDLNRVWQDPDSRIQPVIWAYKGMIKAFTEEREVRRGSSALQSSWFCFTIPNSS